MKIIKPVTLKISHYMVTIPKLPRESPKGTKRKSSDVDISTPHKSPHKSPHNTPQKSPSKTSQQICCYTRAYISDLWSCFCMIDDLNYVHVLLS